MSNLIAYSWCSLLLKSMELPRNLEQNTDVAKKKTTKTNSTSKSLNLMKLNCFRSSDHGHLTVEEVDADGNVDMESASIDKHHSPTHLVVMVNGLIGRLVIIYLIILLMFELYSEYCCVHFCYVAYEYAKNSRGIGLLISTSDFKTYEDNNHTSKIPLITELLHGMGRVG